MGEVDEQAEEEKEQNLFDLLLLLRLDAYVVVVDHVLKGNRKGQQKLQGIFVFAPSLTLLV